MNTELLISELKFKAIRSSGSGGQHVNKVSSKIELQFHLESSEAFSEDEKNMLLETLSQKFTKDYRLIYQCDESRSQHKNKVLVIKRFLDVITNALKEDKERIPTKTPKAVIKKRLENKRQQASKKANRKKPDLD